MSPPQTILSGILANINHNHDLVNNNPLAIADAYFDFTWLKVQRMSLKHYQSSVFLH